MLFAGLPAYTKDIDRMTPVQKGVMEIIKMIPTDMPLVLSRLTEIIASFITLPYDHADNTSDGTTFLAVSKAAITFMQLHATKHAVDGTVSACQLLKGALHALAVPIHLKYSWRQGKEQSSWREATTGRRSWRIYLVSEIQYIWDHFHASTPNDDGY